MAIGAVFSDFGGKINSMKIYLLLRVRMALCVSMTLQLPSERCGYSMELSPNTSIEATFTLDGQYVLSGSGDGNLHSWSINRWNEVASWNSYIGVPSCLSGHLAELCSQSYLIYSWLWNCLFNGYPGQDNQFVSQECLEQSDGQCVEVLKKIKPKLSTLGWVSSL